MVKFIFNRLKELLKDKPTWIFLFTVSLVMALAVSIPMYLQAKAIGGNSMELQRLVPEFDYSTFFDYMRTAKNKFTPFYLIGFGMAFLYLLLNIFFAGGVIDRFENLNTKFNVGRFLSKSWKTFGKYIGVYILVVLVAICVFFASGLFYFVASLLVENGDDQSFVLIMLIPSAILVFSLSFVIAVSDYAKVIIYKFPFVSFSSGFGQSFNFVFKHPKTMGYFWIIIALALAMMGFYLALDGIIGVSGIVTIVLFFVIQQALSFFRIFLRFSHLGVASSFLTQKGFNIPVPIKPEPILNAAISNETEEEEVPNPINLTKKSQEDLDEINPTKEE
jgi:hypothetical protein